nr:MULTISPECIES: ATP-binding protein [unclassified Mesorhizobium]
MMARLTTIKTLAGFDFAFQPSLDRNRIMALAELKFIERAEVVHLLGPPGTGKSHLATALAVEAVKAAKSVYFSTLADIIASLAKAEREGQLRERIRYLCRASLLVVDEIGYLPVVPGGGNLFFQLVNARYEKGAMILTSNRGFGSPGAGGGKAEAARSQGWRAGRARCRSPRFGLRLQREGVAKQRESRGRECRTCLRADGSALAVTRAEAAHGRHKRGTTITAARRHSHPLAALFATWPSVPDKYSIRNVPARPPPRSLQTGAVLDTVKAWPGNLAAGRGAIASAQP